MKNKIVKIGRWFLPVFAFLLFTISCDDDDDSGSGGNFDLATLQATIDQAESLIENSVEGINAGDFQPGAKDDLQDVLNWIYGRIETSDSQADINDAVLKLNAAIDTFLESTVATAFLYVNHGVGSGIELSDNVKIALYQASTIEMEIYIADLNQFGFSNNLFSTEDEPSRGFAARYFGTGEIELVAGTADGWPTSPISPAGTLKSGEWMNIAYTNSGTEQHLYINGDLITSGTGVPEFTDVPFVLGNSPTFNDRSCNTVYREFKVWNSVLDQSTIQGNIGQTVEGTEAGLVVYFPFGANLGATFDDIVGNSTATLQGNTQWEEELPVIIKDFSALQAAIAALTDYRDNTVSEGTNDGDHSVGTTNYINGLLTAAEDLLISDPAQGAIDATAQSLLDTIDFLNDNLVADSNGVIKTEDTPQEDFFRITPAYTPSGDYTIEFEMEFGSFFGFERTEIYTNNHYKMTVTGIADPADESSFFASGELRAESFAGGDLDWQYATSSPLTVVPGEWYHIALVYDAGTDVARLYVNQEMVAEQDGFGLPNGWPAPEIDFFRGQDLLGALRNIRFWDTARNAADLNAAITGSEPDLQMYFPLDRVGGIQVKDGTEADIYTGTLKGGVLWNK
ncbi:LamG domain-containing protein [Muricauda sp. SCSIO 64092]|uniref:LamG domain-containing protein n=1 Tax=Allomuricauda sp. SCSIO 64092 TaxID=2908842 RepID=UPI001FF65937|nr:LamG domain-containing protein [Muricauda sp. SCSIO 64092]UOY05897.1 LamG domain-containing protein [Muricauda sp. SCSIO 64092]